MTIERRAFGRLLIELSRLGTSGRDIDKLLQILLPPLATLIDANLFNRGAILLAGNDGRLWPLAQHNLGYPGADLCLWATPQAAAPEFRPEIHTTLWRSVSDKTPWDEKQAPWLALPLNDVARPLGMLLISVAPGWQPTGEVRESLDDLAQVAATVVLRCMANETLQLREKELEDARIDAIHRLGTASEYRDNETGMHLLRMTQFAGAIGKALDLSPEEQETLLIVAPMHDVGKIGIQDAILLKPGRLTAAEFEKMKRHTEIGGQLLAGEDKLIAAARQVAQHHHEHWNGSGYPHGLEGEAIPLYARICAVADVFDALTSTRPYKAAWPVDEAADWIRSQAGLQFDPAVVVAFEAALPMILRIRNLYRDDILDPYQVVELPEPDPSDSNFITWDDSLSVGIDLIDLHHLYLADLINHLHDVIIRKQGSRKVAVLLHSLGAYAQVHFAAEEKMMAHYGYTGLLGQQVSHRHFKQQVQVFGMALHDSPLTAQMEILDYLRRWFLNHIRHEDAGMRRIVDAPRSPRPAAHAGEQQAALH